MVNVAHIARVVEHQESDKTVRDLEASIRIARIEKARADVEKARARILTWEQGDVQAAVGVFAEIIDAQDRLIAALES